jgi:hypothetical protein
MEMLPLHLLEYNGIRTQVGIKTVSEQKEPANMLQLTTVLLKTSDSIVQPTTCKEAIT